jgi:hypothetical protein
MLSPWFLVLLIFRPWKLKGYIPPERRLTFNGLHSVISQKIVFFITTAVRTLNPIRYYFTGYNDKTFRWISIGNCISVLYLLEQKLTYLVNFLFGTLNDLLSSTDLEFYPSYSYDYRCLDRSFTATWYVDFNRKMTQADFWRASTRSCSYGW